jgi:hypothetical protein
MERVIIDIFAQLDAPEGTAVLLLEEAEKAHFSLAQTVAVDDVTLFFLSLLQ